MTSLGVLLLVSVRDVILFINGSEDEEDDEDSWSSIAGHLGRGNDELLAYRS